MVKKIRHLFEEGSRRDLNQRTGRWPGGLIFLFKRMTNVLSTLQITFEDALGKEITSVLDGAQADFVLRLAMHDLPVHTHSSASDYT